jgi:hypothetical protein
MNLRRSSRAVAGMVLLAAAGVACSDPEVATADVGECIESVASFNIEELPTVECSEDHEAQVVGAFDHEGDDFPGDDEILEEAQDRCQELFEEFVGAPVEETTLSLNTINPTEETWNEADDRETLCVATSADGGQLDQSVEDAADDFEFDGGTPATGSGEDTSLEDFADLVEDCEGGDLAACDDLYFATPVGSEAETVGATCGGQSEERLNGSCEAELG